MLLTQNFYIENLLGRIRYSIQKNQDLESDFKEEPYRKGTCNPILAVLPRGCGTSSSSSGEFPNRNHRELDAKDGSHDLTLGVVSLNTSRIDQAECKHTESQPW